MKEQHECRSGSLAKKRSRLSVASKPSLVALIKSGAEVMIDVTLASILEEVVDTIARTKDSLAFAKMGPLH